ncbi:hydrogenase nickel incorporation protein HypB [Sinimarinibacterium sp. CAU 1509]|uniref:hydrogenase nickel incorporation protein HypB n=1 Tax=Sinimarinibacterium sp. CAU 1509 TaxID=2562283 RepID=UPI0010ABE606|nr:hydrogenase nickel incorporation protein HypB [Sinimarinibacterium sp. CAU 1509]TJY60039.1 hydrogenase nickel incorporation protein HypB [Sinimarinibacterium sp. CAU 1509]
MCNVCGCGSGEIRIEGVAAGQADLRPTVHRHADGSVHAHDHSHDHDHSHAQIAGRDGSGDLHFGHGPAHAHAPGLSQARMVQIEQDILSKNDRYAETNRGQLQQRGIFAINLVSSPGSGKTTLLVRTIEALGGSLTTTVIEGDQQTTNDAERIRATGARAIQINTGKGCHLDAQMVGDAIERLNPPDDSLLLIENVGNLVCPASFDLGEAHKVAILSVTEGEDKPLKYPDMFRAADLMLLNKIDLLPYLSFDVERALAAALQVNPRLQVIQVSATTGAGFDEWLAWLRQGAAASCRQRAQADHGSTTFSAGREPAVAAQG